MKRYRVSEYTDYMAKIGAYYLMNNCRECPFLVVTETCDSKPINCTWMMGLYPYFKNVEAQESEVEE